MSRNRLFTHGAVMTALVALAIGGCGKSESGPTGPAGPAGSANVIHTPWTSNTSATRDTVIDGTFIKVRSMSVPSLTASIIDSGLIVVYMRAGSIGPLMMPYTSGAGGRDNTMNFIPLPGAMMITRATPSATNASEAIGMSSGIEYRCIMVPGGVRGLRAAPDLDWRDYASVQAAFGLRD